MYPERTQNEEKQDTGLRQGTYQRSDFTEPRLLHLSIHRKALNSLALAVWFSLIDRTLSMFHYLVFIAKLLYILVHPVSLWDITSELSEKLSSLVKSSASLLNKT